MLRRLSSDHAGFKSIDFKSGLNILLATRADGAEDAGAESRRRSRNGAGKSSVLDLVHFMLGGAAQGALTAEAVASWTYALEFDLGHERVQAWRCPSDAKKIVAQIGPRPTIELSNAQWCQELGEAWFGLGEKRGPGDTSYRQLISYFARRKREGGLDSPVRAYLNQPVAASETSLAELFGLDANLVRQLHQTKAALKQTKAAQTALVALDKASAPGSRRADLEAQLQAQIAAAKLVRDRLALRIDAFNVLPEFRELEGELARLNREFRELSDGDVIDQEAIDVNSRALASETLAEAPDLDRLFAEASIVFPDLVVGRYAEVQRFHQQLIENRQSHLQTEIAAAERRIQDRQPRREAIEVRRREIVRALRSTGPADELLRLRDELAGREAELQQLEGRLQEARTLEERVETLEQDLEEAVRKLRQDRRERSAIAETASRTFSEISERLYERPGQLAISATETGLRFLPTTPSDASAGVMSMEIFCFDLTLALLAHRRGHGPGFIIHDSHLFEPVDGRQFARALEIAHSFAEESGIQYIALLNSDELARAETESGASFGDYVLPTKLSDTEDGGLFGLRFD
jgi:uncharacterized protein YydD (DUF2326 family)